jgi:hypothetical protein
LVWILGLLRRKAMGIRLGLADVANYPEAASSFLQNKLFTDSKQR